MKPDWSQPQICQCTVQPYPWGEKGPEATITRLVGGDGTQPAAELWMGAHPKAPSRVAGKGLDEWMALEPEAVLGEKSLNAFGKTFPYLFKVLSAADPLSIQLHPKKSEAEELHAKDAQHYPDDNHKPEIAIALEKHEALIGFEPLSGLVTGLMEQEELCQFLGEKNIDNLQKAISSEDPELQKKSLYEVFCDLFRIADNDPTALKESSAAMAKRLKYKAELNPKEQWFIELQEHFPEGDVGLYCFFFLNYRVLEKGEGVFLKADVPHAYLRGNIIECMANSDNVVRAGLTPKFVDVETLCNIVEVGLEPLPIQTSDKNGLGGGVFEVPVPEFRVHHWKGNIKEISTSSLPGPKILVMMEGEAQFKSLTAKAGDVIFLADACEENMDLDGEAFLATAAL